MGQGKTEVMNEQTASGISKQRPGRGDSPSGKDARISEQPETKPMAASEATTADTDGKSSGTAAIEAVAETVPAPCGIGRIVSDGFLSLGILLTSIVMAFLFVTSFAVTAVSPVGEHTSELVALHTVAEPEWALKMALGGICMVLVVIGCVLAYRRADAVDERRMVAVMFVATLVLGIAWCAIVGEKANGFTDSWNVTIWARELARGDFSDFAPHVEEYAVRQLGERYLDWYPYQSNILLLLTGMAKLVGPDNLVSMALAINCLSASLTALAIWRCTCVSGRPKGERLVTAALAFTFLPSVLISVFIYGNSAGLCLMAWACVPWIKAMRRDAGSRHRVLLSISGAILMGLAVLVKPTFTAAAGACVLVLLAHLIRSHDWRMAFGWIVTLPVSIALAGAVPVSVMESFLGYELPPNAPKTSWLVIGLSDDSIIGPMAPGWWGRYAVNNRKANFGDWDAEAEQATADLQERVTRLAGDPAYALWFFTTKAMTMWDDPTYQSMYLSSLGVQDLYKGSAEASRATFNPVDKSTPVGWASAGMMVFMDGWQTATYGLALAGAASMWWLDGKRKAGGQGRDPADYLMPCVFFVGYCLYIVWEAKGMYALPFTMFLIPLAARGTAWLSGWVLRVRDEWLGRDQETADADPADIVPAATA